MPTLAADKKQLNVRVDRHAAELLDAQIARAKRAGRRVSKEKLVSDAIVAAYGGEPEHGWLPVFESRWVAPAETATSNAAMLDWLERTEAGQA